MLTFYETEFEDLRGDWTCTTEPRPIYIKSLLLFEHVHEKTNNFGFGPGPTQTGLYNHRGRLEA